MRTYKCLLIILLVAGKIMAQPVIISQPLNQTILANSNAAFTVTVIGPAPYTYQWLFNGTNLPNGIITTIAGKLSGPPFLGDNGAATNAHMANPFGMAVDVSGNIFIADTSNYRIRKVDTNGIISTVAGNGLQGYSGDGGAATNARIKPVGVTGDSHGNIFISEGARIRKVNGGGIITTIAGNGTNGYSGDGGQATNAEINTSAGVPTGLMVDLSNNLYFTDAVNNRIRKVDTNGVITTFAGNGSSAYSGDGGAAINAGLALPSSVTADEAGNIFFAEISSHRIRKVDTNGIITTMAGNGTYGFSGDGGAATNAALIPDAISFDAAGNLFIGDNDNRRIRKVDTNGIITTIVGNGTIGSSGDGGMDTNATIGCPFAVCIDPFGNLLILDELGSVVRKVWFAGLPILSLNKLSPTVQGNYQVIVTGSSGSVTSSIAALTLVYPAFTQANISTNNGGFTLAWPVFQPSIFQVEFTTNIAGANWSNLGNTISYSASTNGTVLKVDPSWTNDLQRFYRLRWVQ